MKVCLVHEEYPEETNFGGIATYQKTLAEELVRKGNKVIVICRGLEKNQKYIENGVTIYRIFVKKTSNQVNDYKKYRKKVSILLRKLQNNHQIDIIETPDWGAETIFFEKYRKVPLVVRLHTPLKVWLKYNQNNFGNVTDLLLKWEKKMILSADCVTCCSQILKEIIVKEFSINESKIMVSPNPANITDFFRDDKIKKENEIVFVGSLEERKGVIVLAKALNIVFKKYPNLKINFIGKDTCRNSKNISTKKYILSIIKDKNLHNIEFVGQLSNVELNKYLNRALVGVYPSLFDNFPYVVLESMTTGLHIVGSKNSGMTEMLRDDSSIYLTGDYVDLANKIIEKYEIALQSPINFKNINIVKKEYNSSKIVDDIIDNYNLVKAKKNAINVTCEELNAILNFYSKEKIVNIKKENGGVANLVYRVKTKNHCYIIKKYLYKYDFTLAQQLYNIYESQEIRCIKPLNRNPIYYNQYMYNIFEYMKDTKKKKKNYEYFNKIICCKKDCKVDINNCDSILNEKMQKYFNYLKNNIIKNKMDNEILYVLNQFETLKNKTIFNELYINHGDISINNIISFNKQYYLIDFDEVCYATRLYDFAVIIIKNYTNKDKINYKSFVKLKQMVMQTITQYSDSDFIDALKYYLCKVLLEKFYLYYENVIDLYSKNQKKDYYKKYYNLLKNIENL